jgi:uncharacterized protein (TIGR00251 family)
VLSGTGRDLRVHVRLTPKARRARIEGPIASAGGRRLKVCVTAPPVDGKANAALCQMLAKTWGLPPSALSVIRGASGRDKVVAVGADADMVRRWFAEQGWL